MLSRIAARLITGPAAFFVAWVIDVAVFAFTVLRDAARRGRPHRRA